MVEGRREDGGIRFVESVIAVFAAPLHHALRARSPSPSKLGRILLPSPPLASSDRHS